MMGIVKFNFASIQNRHDVGIERVWRETRTDIKRKYHKSCGNMVSSGRFFHIRAYTITFSIRDPNDEW